MFIKQNKFLKIVKKIFFFYDWKITIKKTDDSNEIFGIF